MTRRLRWPVPGGRPPIPKRPYRDSALFNGLLASIIVVVALATGGSTARALAVAVGFFVLATAWSWWRFRARLAAREEKR